MKKTKVPWWNRTEHNKFQIRQGNLLLGSSFKKQRKLTCLHSWSCRILVLFLVTWLTTCNDTFKDCKPQREGQKKALNQVISVNTDLWCQTCKSYWKNCWFLKDVCVTESTLLISSKRTQVETAEHTRSVWTFTNWSTPVWQPTVAHVQLRTDAMLCSKGRANAVT